MIGEKKVLLGIGLVIIFGIILLGVFGSDHKDRPKQNKQREMSKKCIEECNFLCQNKLLTARCGYTISCTCEGGKSFFMNFDGNYFKPMGK